MHLKEGEIVGEWRDSTYGIGGGKIPFDVNSALVPAALRSIARLSSVGILDLNTTLIDEYAKTWEDSVLQFFEITIPLSQARKKLETYVNLSGTAGLKSQSGLVDDDVKFHALALEGNDDLSLVSIMNTDSCFRLFMLNTTNQPQLTSFLNATANNIQRIFPAGLMTDVGLLVSNPAYGNEPVYLTNWTTSNYHGTVVWSWQLAMMAKGIELQLARCHSKSAPIPDFCADEKVHLNVKKAYNQLWDSIDANARYLTGEVWSWRYDEDGNEGQGRFEFVELGALPPPMGEGKTESDVVQLWSLTFLAVRRDEGLK